MTTLSTMLRIETKLFLRDPSTVMFGVLFPSALLVGLGLIPALREPVPGGDGLRGIDAWAPTALVFGMVLIAVQHVPSAIATYRERGILRRMSTTPVHPARVLLVQMTVAFGSVVLAALLLIAVAWTVLGIAPPERPLQFAVAFVAGYAAVLGISLIIAAVVPSSSAANQIGTLLFVLLMFFGGAFLPRALMPEVLQDIGQFIPPGLQALTMAWSEQAGRLASGPSGQPFWLQIGIMAGIAVIASAVAAKLFRWE